MLGDTTSLANDHVEFGMLRDVVALYKFLCTMESREAELMRRRMGSEDRRYMPWSLTFDDEGSGSVTPSLNPTPLRWEVTNFRGIDQDTADVDIVGFGDRKLRWGEGLVVQSPADVGRLLGMTMPSEDDILHAEKLPGFADTLSREESETLMSYLTCEYIRIPLVVSFFATRDRQTYLFNPQLQGLIRAVLFEPGAWVEPSGHRPVTMVPLRQTAEQKRQAELDHILNAKRGKMEPGTLATVQGLLLNELMHAPGGVLTPLMSMFHSVADLCKAPVNSPEASYILFMIHLALRVESYVLYALHAPVWLAPATRTPALLAELADFASQLSGFLHGLAEETLERWRVEAEANEDMPTAAVVHAYKALLYANLRDDGQLTDAAVASILTSLSFVHNWHGFGLGKVEGDSESDPEQRVLRFLQAYGIDTQHVRPGSLQGYLKGRPLFLRLGRTTVRAPMLGGKAKSNEKTPPADVPEYEILQLLQKQRRRLVKYLKE